MPALLSLLQSRPALWLLASSSFACLLGHFYSYWTMRAFALCVFLPVTILLLVLAFKGTERTRFVIVQGALGGLFAAVIYDLFRLPFVFAGKPLFGVFPQFGQLLLSGELNDDTSFWPQILGWIYHFQNGMALGIMGAAMLPRASAPSTRFGICIAWATVVEILLLLSPYYHFLGLHLPMSQFVPLTLAAHLIFGAALGGYFTRHWFQTARE